MLKNELIIYFGPEPWEGLWRNRHQLMSRLAEQNEVWYVEPPTFLKNVLRKGTKGTRLCSRDPSGVRVFHSPWWLPIVGRPPFDKVSYGIYFHVLRRITGANKKRPILWLSRPGMRRYLGRLKEKLSVYHIVDEYSGYGEASPQKQAQIVAREALLLATADVTIAVTPSLVEAKSSAARSIHLVPNAAEYSAYARSDYSVPSDLAGIKGPIIGYTGLIAARLDLALLTSAAQMRPDWSFVFVGTIDDAQCVKPLQKLKSLDNTYFLGRKSVDATPAYVQQFDVSTIPYAVNLRAEHASPLKLYEYAAAGKPIIATDFRAAREFGGQLRIANTPAELIAACEEAISEGPESAALQTNRKFAAQNTWTRRVEQIAKILSEQPALRD